jgi:hypothetical protein
MQAIVYKYSNSRAWIFSTDIRDSRLFYVHVPLPFLSSRSENVRREKNEAHLLMLMPLLSKPKGKLIRLEGICQLWRSTDASLPQKKHTSQKIVSYIILYSFFFFLSWKVAHNTCICLLSFSLLFVFVVLLRWISVYSLLYDIGF